MTTDDCNESGSCSSQVVALDRFLSRDLRAFFLAAFFYAKQKDDKSNWYLRFNISINNAQRVYFMMRRTIKTLNRKIRIEVSDLS